jgi:hypothetical protein
MPDILNRFETITFNLFDKHSIQVVGFWTRTDVNELVYICKYESEEAMEKAWDAFRADPDWIAARDKTEANGPIVDEVISHVLIPTAFSPMQ